MGEMFLTLWSSCGLAGTDASDAFEAGGAPVCGVSCDFPV